MSDTTSPPLVDEEVKALLDLALDAVIQARILLSGPRGVGHSKLLDEVSLVELKQELISERYRSLIEERSLPRIKQTGDKGARILLRLLDEPDRYVSHQALAEAAELRSPTSAAIKVYVCHIRNAFEERGYPADMIETGHGTYRVRSDNIDPIIEFLSNA